MEDVQHRSILRWIIRNRCFATRDEVSRAFFRPMDSRTRLKTPWKNVIKWQMATTVKIIIKRWKRKDAYAILRSTSHHRVECFCTLPWVSLTCVITLRDIYIYIFFFFLFMCYKSPWKNIFAFFPLLAFQGIVIVYRLIVALIGANTCVCIHKILYHFFSRCYFVLFFFFFSFFLSSFF